MLYSISSSTVKMAGTAYFSTGFPNILGQVRKSYRFECLSTKRFFLIGGMPAIGGKFIIRPGSVMACEAVYPFLCAVIKVLVLPSVSRMTAGTPAPVGLWGNSKIVQVTRLAQTLDLLINGLPCPVECVLYLSGGLVVAFKTGFGNLRAGFEWCSKLLKF